MPFDAVRNPRRQIKIKAVQPISAWHGSPHCFDRFSLDAVGTGEGNRAFGYGLYFTETREIAEKYYEGLSIREFYYQDAHIGCSSRLYDTFSGESEEFRQVIGDVRNYLSFAGIGAALSRVRMQYEAMGYCAVGVRRKRAKALQKQFQAMKQHFRAADGRLYKVRINREPNDFLLWDQPMKRQSAKAQSLLAVMPQNIQDKINTRISETSGADEFYQTLGEILSETGEELPKFGSCELASNHLKARGFAGIKYLDGGSREDAEDGKQKTYNYVVFDERDVEIIKIST